jgi:hypothetical protein
VSHRKNLKVKNYSKVCWSRKTKSGSPHLHIIETHGKNGKEGEEFCFWATGWRQLVYKCDTMSFRFGMSTHPKRRKHSDYSVSFEGPDGIEEFWKVIDLDTLIVLDRKGEEIERGYGPVERGKKYGVSRKFMHE